jgi:hypothetical protein|tara:strand:- start:733 stop:1554 length:822 start_codon:yes stop_codon:yes gene_type:complete
MNPLLYPADLFASRLRLRAIITGTSMALIAGVALTILGHFSAGLVLIVLAGCLTNSLLLLAQRETEALIVDCRNQVDKRDYRLLDTRLRVFGPVAQAFAETLRDSERREQKLEDRLAEIAHATGELSQSSQHIANSSHQSAADIGSNISSVREKIEATHSQMDKLLGQAQDGIAATGQSTGVERIRLGFLCERIEALSSTAHTDLKGHNRSGLRSLKDAGQTVGVLLSVIETEFLSAAAPKLPAAAYFDQTTKAISAQFAVVDEMLLALQQKV